MSINLLFLKYVFLIIGCCYVICSCVSPTDSGTKKKNTIIDHRTLPEPNIVHKESDSKELLSTSIDPEQIEIAQSIIQLVAQDDLDLVDSKLLFKKNCSICHGLKGNMKINGAKDLTKSILKLEESVAMIYFGQGLMTPFKGVLTDEEIYAIAHYIRDLRTTP